MELRLRAFLQVRAVAAVTWDAGVEARPVDVVVVTEKAVHASMPVVRKVEWQRGRAIKRRLAESRAYPVWGEPSDSHDGGRDDTYDPQ